MRALGTLIVVLTLLSVACGDDENPTVDAAAADAPATTFDGAVLDAPPIDAPGLLPFGAACTDNAQCESDLCYAFGDGTQACTQTCTVDDDCPAGSQGQKCNLQGVCRV